MNHLLLCAFRSVKCEYGEFCLLTQQPGRSQPPQIGLGRLITDHVSFAYLTDVYILAPYQGRGLGKFLIRCIDEVLDSWPQFRRALLMADSREKRFYEQMLRMREVVQGEHGFTMMTRKGEGSVIPV